MDSITQSFEECTDEGSGERVVISGMSGLYPESRSVKDLSHILYNKINPVNAKNPRWQYEHPEVPLCTGKVPGLMSFDAQFFKVHLRLGITMDSMTRKMQEQSYQAIFDAGINPIELSGKNVGVFVGSCFSETEKACFYVAHFRRGLGIVGCSKAMFANRISYWLNAKGPSVNVDNACCSSTAALEQAYFAITQGDCEAAIVGGASLCLHPHTSVHNGRIMEMSMDGKTRSFDSNASGCARSEAISVLFLQKAKDARRVYAELLHVKCEFNSLFEDETGPKLGFNRNPSNVASFIRNFYAEAKVSPKDVKYVEAFGSATVEVDKMELEAISEVFCKNRSDPLLVGSVMSNIGYVEAATGISAITKILLGYHTGQLAANLHYESPRQDIPAVRDGRLRILDEHKEFDRTYTAVNGFSFGGVNAHVLLHGRYKPKDSTRYKANIPQLVTLSGRQNSSVKSIINNLKSRPIDPEELALLRNIHKFSVTGHLGRGFIILDTNEDSETISLCEKSDNFDDAKRPLWFMYSGMGSQWSGMGAQLMRIPIFAAAIKRCQHALQPKGVDVIKIITSTDKTIFDNILHSFVGIAAIQIGLTDVLTELGIVPDMIIGHSVGELGCAYADGCFTAEEMILSAYSRGLVSLQTPFIRGSMAAIGIGYGQISKMCPPEIEVACHNGPDSSTISGPADEMKEFVAQLTAKGIFAKEVPCSNIAYHSRYIAEAGPSLLKYLSEVIKSPKPRSERWVSTSLPQHRWNEPIAKYSSAEYHTNNLLNSVLFEETSRLIPANAVVVEIAPHGLLQAIVKRSLPPSCQHVPLTRRGHVDNALFLLEAIGKLYMEGFDSKIEVLYPKIEYPVSTGTPMLSHLVEWAYHEKWPLPLYMMTHRKTAAACQYIISTHDDENVYLKDHVIKEKILYPLSSALVLVWDTLAMVLGLEKKQFSIQFNEIRFHSQPMLHNQRTLRLNVALQRGTGRFEVLDGNTKVLTGYAISEIKEKDKFANNIEVNKMHLNANDIYKLLLARDYHYSGKFKSIHNSNWSFSEGNIIWEDNWVTALDGMIQLNVLRRSHETISQPEYIRKIVIDVTKHRNSCVCEDGKTVIPAKVFDVQDYTRCGGIILENIRFYDYPFTSNKNIALKVLQFVPHFSSNIIDKVTGLYVYLQIVSESLNKRVINVVEIIRNINNKSDYMEMNKIILDISDIRVNYSVAHKEIIANEEEGLSNDVDLLLSTNLSRDDNMCQILHRKLRCDTFLINTETEMHSKQPSSLYRSVCAHATGSMLLELLLWRPTNSHLGTSAVTVLTKSDFTLFTSRIPTLPVQQKIVVFTSYPPYSGLKSLTKKLRNEKGHKINLIMINHKTSSEQLLDQIPLSDLPFNILDHGKLGGEYYLPVQKKLMKSQSVMLDIDRVGDLDSLHWIGIPMLTCSGIKVTVHYAGINDVEVKKKTGFISLDKNRTGYFDFSGLTESGAQVMGVADYKSIQTHIKVKPELLWPVPEHWSLEDAATVPLAYCLAFYCLRIKSDLWPRMSVLVHGGSGALGQAVISIALANGCDVFTTVSDIKKKHFLLTLFPELKDNQVGNSRDISFADMVLQQTKGLGCNIVIANGVKDELKTMSIKCCQPTGCFIDTSILLNQELYDLGMAYLTDDISFYTTDLFSSTDEIKELQVLVSEGIARGYVRPLTRVTYPPQEVPRAFRLKATNHHRGRVLLDLQQDVSFIQTKINCSPQLYQMVLAENELLAMKLADRLVTRGARKIILIRTNTSNCLLAKLRIWAKQGIQVKVVLRNVFNETNITNLLNTDELKSVEGIYYIFDKMSDEERSTLEQVIVLSQTVLSTLKYGAIIYAGQDTWEDIGIPRTDENLLSWIRLPIFKNLGDQVKNEEVISEAYTIDAIERAMCLKQRDVIVHSMKNLAHTSFLHEITSKADIDIIEDALSEDNITDLSTQPAKFETLRTYLRNMYHISIEENLKSTLNVKTILDLEEKLTDKLFKETDGLKTFFSYVDHDELLATTEMVFLPTLTKSSEMRVDEFDVNETFLCVIPGMEGLHARFRTLCERLKLPALVLQPGYNSPHETIQEMAERFAKFLLKKTQLKNKYYIVGYECGVLVALEMAAILEDEGLIGTVFCIGGSPSEVQATIEENLSTFKTEEELEDAVVSHMYTLIANKTTEELDKTLQKSITWKEKVDSCVNLLLGRVKHSNQYTEDLIKSAYAKIVQARRYIAEPRKLRSRIICLRPSSVKHSEISSLQNYSIQNVVEYQLEAPLAFAAQDLQCSAIINRHLDEEILERFNQKNLCETYVFNTESFFKLDVDDQIDM